MAEQMAAWSSGLWLEESHYEEMSFKFLVDEILYSTQSQFQKIEVLKTRALGKMFRLDGLTMLSEGDAFIYNEMIAHVPLLSHENPKNILLVGSGLGGSLTEILKHKSVEKVDCIEIDPDVVDCSKLHFPNWHKSYSDSRVHLYLEDAAAFVGRGNQFYDVVIFDTPDPLGPAKSLFEASTYQNLLRLLNPGAILVFQSSSPFCEPDLQIEILRKLKNTFQEIAPYNYSMLSFPWSLWSLCLARVEASASPLGALISGKEFSESTRYYNSGIHGASFCLPNFQKKALQSL